MDRFRRWLFRGILLGGCLLLIAAVATGIYFWLAGSALDRRIKELRAAGEPATFEDLVLPMPPPDQNAAIFLQQADAVASNMGRRIEQLISDAAKNEDRRDESPRAATQKEAKDLYAELCALLEKAADCPEYLAPLDFSGGPQGASSFVMNRVQRGRSIVQLLANRAGSRAAEGDREAAMRDCLRIFRLSRLYEKEPFIISQTESIQLRTLGVQTTNTVLRSGSLPPNARAELDRELALSEGDEGLRYSMKTERVQALEYLTRDPFVSRIQGIGVRRFYYAASEMIDDQFDLLAMPYQAAKAAAADWNATHVGDRYVLAKMSLQSYAKARLSLEKSRARIRSLRLFNALQAADEKGKKENVKLEELGLPAGATIDPFNEEPLRILKRKVGWVVYSVGENLVDDGGDLEQDKDIGVGPPAPVKP